MRPFAPLVSRRSTFVRFTLGTAFAVGLALTTIQAQIPGRNVNMVSGNTLPDGDPFLQRQNEPSIAASTRNPLHLLGGSNDYRTVDVPGVCLLRDPVTDVCLQPAPETGDAWLGLFKSTDGGQRWNSTLLPGYPQDQSDAGLASPLKGYQAGADPVVRPGTNGLFYYSGLVFDRGEGGKSGVFISRFIDNNNQEAGDPVAYLGTVMVARSKPGQFLDKPWLAVDIPRPNAPTCTITADNMIETGPRPRPRWGRRGRRGNQQPAPGAQRIKAGAAYVAYTSFTGAGETLRSEIFLTRSTDCGATWSEPIRISASSDPVNQGASLTINPVDGSVFVAWRRFSTIAKPDLDGVMTARLPFGAKKFETPWCAYSFPKRKGQKVGRRLDRIFEHGRVKARPSEAADLDEFDQGTSTVSFRTNAYPTTTTDGTGRVYIAWTQRGFAHASLDPVNGDARIVMTTTRDGRNFSPLRAVDDDPQYREDPSLVRGHQIMPTLAFAGGRLMLVYYDLRETKAATFGRFITDQNTATGLRHTIDIRAAMARPGSTPQFDPSVKISDYLMGYTSAAQAAIDPVTGKAIPEQLQFNPPNLPMFALGTVPFMGDYIDVAAAQPFISLGNGRWGYNTAASAEMPAFHAAWTDNRDVRPPAGGDWTKYTPVRLSPAQAPGSTPGSASPFDPTQTVPICTDGNAGSRNQNIYGARITAGLLAGSPGNTKPLSMELQRAFVVFAQNTTNQTKSFRMTILNQPPGGRASFEQFPLPPYTTTPAPPAPLTSIDMTIPPRSTASRTVYATSTDAKATMSVDVSEIDDINLPETENGLEARVMLNPDVENPDVENPDVENPDVENMDIMAVEVYNPDVENPDVENPDVENPDVENPDVENPDVENVVVVNPDVENIGLTNPDVENPDVENPDVENPDVENPDVENGTITDISWNVSNQGNTTSAFNVNMFLAQAGIPAGLKTQLILHKIYKTPVATPNGCDLKFETRNILIANIPNPVFITPEVGSVPDQNDPSVYNATMWLAPGENAKITLRVVDDNKFDNDTVINDRGEPVSVDPFFAPATGTTPGVGSQGVDSEEAGVGVTDPPVVTPTGSNLVFVQVPLTAVEDAPIAPPVSVRMFDNSGAALAGVEVTLALGGPPLDIALTGNTAITGPDGIATFAALAVGSPATGLTLVASAVFGTVTASAISPPFDVASALIPTEIINTNDSGPGSLRAAMQYANLTPGNQTLTFNIPDVSPVTPAVIELQTPLPAITSTMVIDGRTQPGYDNRPVVEVNWQGVAEETNGFTIEFDQVNVEILGLAITNFTGFGIQSLQADSPGGGGHKIRFNTIGTDRFNAVEKGNQAGIEIRTDNAVVEANLISGNASVGILVRTDADDVVIGGNRIGTTFDGLSPLPNDSGIRMFDSVDRADIISNLISGNAEYGIDIQNSEGGDVTGTRIRGNRIGISDNGSLLKNGDGGIKLENAPGTVIGEPGGGGNFISGNGGPGIWVLGTQTPKPLIQSNVIGLNPTGGAVPNRPAGIRLEAPALIGGTAVGERNFISGNTNGDGGGAGIEVLEGADTTEIFGNFIGLNMAGDAVGNGYSGITVYGTVSNITIGNTTAGTGNVIGGNPHTGIAIYVVGPGPRPSNITVQGNLIGLHPNGDPRPNGRWGIWTLADNVTIGGGPLLVPVGGNVIAHNGVFAVADTDQGGVGIEAGSTGVRVGLNRIFNNRGLGIDLGKDGLVLLNDSGDTDTGPNGKQNFPVLSGPTNAAGATTRVNFALDSIVVEAGPPPVPSYSMRFYASVTCDPSGHGEGEREIGLVSAFSGNGTGSIFLSELVPPGQFLTATATNNATNETSEFGGCIAVPVPGPPATITAVSPNPSAPGFGQMVWITGTNLAAGSLSDVIVKSGGIDYPATNLFSFSSSLVVARLSAAIPYGPATIRVKSPGPGGLPSNEFGITLQATPAAPVVTGLFAGACGDFGGTNPITSASPGSPIVMTAFNIDTNGSTMVVTPVAGGPPTSVFVSSTCAGPGGTVAATFTVPGFAPGTVVNVQMRTQVGSNPSPLSNSFTITITGPVVVVGPAGGSGGTPFPTVDCPTGSVVVGLQGRAGDDIDQTRLVCAPTPALAPQSVIFVAGGFGGADYGSALTCGAGAAVTGVFGATRSGAQIDYMGVTCTDLTTGVMTNSGTVGLSQAPVPFTLSCPAGKEMIGIEGRQGALLDQISIRCQ